MKIHTLPKIRIDPPQGQPDIAVALDSSSSARSVESFPSPPPPPPARLRAGTIAKDAQPFYLKSPAAGGRNPHAAVAAAAPLSHASAIPSFYTVSGERPPHTGHDSNSDEDPFADPGSGDSDRDGPLSPVPL